MTKNMKYTMVISLYSIFVARLSGHRGKSMKGKFKYYEPRLHWFSLALIFPGMLICEIWENEGMAIGLSIIFISFVMSIFSLYIPGSYTADGKGIFFKILLRTYDIRYSDINSVRVSNRHLYRWSRGVNIVIETRLTLKTDNAVYSFKSKNYLTVMEQIKDPANFEKRMHDFDFIRLGKFIGAKISE